MKAAHMASIGPITMQSVKFFQRNDTSFEEAKILAVQEFLQYKLEYTEEEIRETRLSTKGDGIINIAMAMEEMIRDLYIHKAECGDDKVVVRSYIPPTSTSASCMSTESAQRRGSWISP